MQAVGGLLVGIVVGLTGMGGGALMTPMLVFFFRADPLTAISSDLVASFVMKPAGALVHLRNGTVNLGLVRLLCLGSVPAAFFGAWFISQQPRGADLDSLLKVLLGLALLKSPAMDAAVRMATEAGATRIQPILSSRSVATGDRVDRWERIADLPAARHHMPLATVGAAFAAEYGLEVREDLVLTIVTIGSALILGIAHEDAGRASATAAPTRRPQ